MLGDDTVQQVLADVETASISDQLRATLRFLRKVTREHAGTTPEDVKPLIALGITRRQIQDALEVAFAFNVITRLADTFEFEVSPQSVFDAGARHLLKRGYR